MSATAYASSDSNATPQPLSLPHATLVVLTLAYVALSAGLIAAVAGSHDVRRTAIMVTSLVMFPICVHSATRLLGWPATRTFVLLGLSIGWFAEQMGSTDGWFFGRYTYTDVLGPRLGNVPVVIPMMWFVLTYTGYVLANLILWHRAIDERGDVSRAAGTSFIAAMIVTAYDLGADPYLVYVMKAWIMEKTDGAWFGETVQGFVGWTFIGFVILFAFRLLVRRAPAAAPTPAAARAALVPMAIYGSGVAFQMTFGHPVETRSIAAFAMGIPLLCAVHGWRQWRLTAAGQSGVAR